MKQAILKMGVGIDMAKNDFVLAIAFFDHELKPQKTPPKKFSNDHKGFKAAIAFVQKSSAKFKLQNKPTWVVEATGVYHEDLLYFLANEEHDVAVMNPLHMKRYIESLAQRSKTDNLDAQAIAQFALERNPKLWQKPIAEIQTLRALYRERMQWMNEKVRLQNRLHALNHAYNSPKSTIKRYQQEIKRLQSYIDAIEKEAQAVVNHHPVLAKKFKILQQVKGVAFITVLGVVAETGGFTCSANVRRLVAYAGLDIRLKESGAFKGKSTLSKRGNGNLRSALFMAALSAGRYDTAHGAYVERIRSRYNYKKVGTVAMARKLLVLLKALWEGDADYDPNYGKSACTSDLENTSIESVGAEAIVAETTEISTPILANSSATTIVVEPLNAKKKVGKLVTSLQKIAAVP
jgi:transposase